MHQTKRPADDGRRPRGSVARRLGQLAAMAALGLAIQAIPSLPEAFLGLPGSETSRMASDFRYPALPAEDQVVAFVNVNVVPMDRPRFLPAQTVIVRGQRVLELGPVESVRVPDAAVRIDGQGRYLMPGLADMHIHLGGYDAETTETVLGLLALNGVTTVLNLHGTPAHLELRRRLETGEPFGPTVYTSGPFISDAPHDSPTPGEAEWMVWEQKRAGYDLIKIHGDFSITAYRRLFAAARAAGMRVVGHAPRNLGMDIALEERQDAVAHAEEYLYAYFFYPYHAAPVPADLESQIRHTEAQAHRVAQIARATSRAGARVIANLTAYRTIGLQVADLEAVLRRPELAYVPSSIVAGWLPEYNDYVRRFPRHRARHFQARYELLQKLVAGLNHAGVPLLVGTDTPIPAIVPGFSVHDELAELVAAGLSPYEALRAATTNAAEFLGALDQFGLLRAGSRADLILVDGNPLKDLSLIRRPAGIMLRGRWLPGAEIRQLLESMAVSD